MAKRAGGSLSRRELLRRSGEAGALLALPVAFAKAPAPGSPVEASNAVAQSPQPPDVYAAIGVRPMINARGTFTIISGSTMLPEVRAAMDAASRRYVHLDELTEAIGARLATLTQAEWGLVTSGCSAALTHATAACVAGGSPDLHVRIPHLQGFAKDEVIIPSYLRNVYDAAIRAVGVRVVTVSTVAELEAAIGPRTAMIYVLAGPSADQSVLSVRAMAPIATSKGVPILVDAAAEILTIPNVHLQQGATLVAYSGGKCLRGPQAAGLLLGRKDLVKAAWVHSAPHHGPHRGYKVGKEEAIGMLAAVEAWVKRDHDAEWKRWTGWLEHIAQKVKTVDGVTTEIVQPQGLSNRTPSLRVRWERARLNVTGDVVVRTLFDGEPRITLTAAGGGDPAQTGVSITPYMMAAGEERIVADRLHAVLTKPPAVTTTTPSGTHGRSIGRVGRADSVRGDRVQAHAAAPPARRGDRRRAPGRLHHARADRIDGRRHRAAAQLHRRRAAATRCRSSSTARLPAANYRERSTWANTSARRGPRSGAPGARGAEGEAER